MKGLYKYSFFNYFKSLTYAPAVRIPVLTSVLAVYCVLGTGTFGAISANNGWGFLLSFMCAMVFFAGIIMGNYFNRKPDLNSLMPLSPAKSLLYRFLSVLYMFLLMMVAVIVVMAVVSAIVMLFSFIPGCNGAFEDVPEDAVEEIVYPIGVYGGIFAAAYFVFMYAAGMIAGFITKPKYRNIYLISLCVAVLLVYVLMNLPIYGNPEYQVNSVLAFSPFSGVIYDAMKLPWLCVTLCCVVAAAALGVAIYLGIKENKLKSSY